MAIGPINYKDPRFQEAMLQAGAGGPRNQLGLSQQLTDKFTTQQIGQRLGFQRLGTQKRGFESNLNLGLKGLALQDKYFRKDLDYRKRESNITAGVGLLTGGLSFLEGRRRKKALLQDAATIQRRHKEITAAIRGNK